METIYSLVTKPINQNVGIIRISGSRTFEIIKKLFPEFIPSKNKVEFKKLYYKNEFIDDVLILTFIAPESFTGEDVVEIHCHGSLFIISKIISILNKFELRQAKNGEFMQQAFMNGKIDLLQSEAIDKIVTSEDVNLTNQALKNLNGEQKKFITELLNNLEDLFSRIQVSIDYPENTDLPKYNLVKIKDDFSLVLNKLEKIIFDSQKLIKYSEWIILSIIGMPNVGKSTLLYTLVKENRAIVSNIEGTTRDIIESNIYIDNIKFTIRDTAGIRNKTNDLIEKEGINRALNSIKESDIILLLIDGTKNIEMQLTNFSEIISENKNNLIKVITKSDLNSNKNYLSISALNNDIDDLLNNLKKFVSKNIFDFKKNQNPILITQNQIDQFFLVKEGLENIISFIEKENTLDVITYELEYLIKKVSQIIGKEIDQNYLTNLFSNFCIGK